MFPSPNESSASGLVGPCVSLGQPAFLPSAYTAVVCHTGVGITGDLSELRVSVDLATPLPTVMLRGIADLRVDESKCPGVV